MLDLAFIPQASPGERSIAQFEATAYRPGRAVWLARGLLRPFLSDFALNGIFGTYPLYLMGTEHWRALLGERAGGRLLDVGAAAGDVTATLAPLFDSVVATDTARPMVRRLHRRGWESYCMDLATTPLPWPALFDTVALLNVLDRAADAPRLLEAAVRACVPGGNVLVALTLPYNPWHYVGAIPARPRQRLPLDGLGFEEDLDRLVHRVLPDVGLVPLRWVRTPYVSVGQQGEELYSLDCAVVLCRRPR